MEQTAEVRRLANALAVRQTPDFESWETLVLQASRRGGAGVMGSLLTHWQRHAPREIIRCACGQRMTSRGHRAKESLTTMGPVPFARAFYQCPACQQGRFPDDECLDIVQTSYSPGVRRLMARAGSQTQFAHAAADLLCYAGLVVDPREIQRIAEEVGREVEQWLGEEQLLIRHQPGVIPICPVDPTAKFYVSFDGTGVPVRKDELVGRKGKQADGSARTREVKLGCVFTQVKLDAEGYPQRDPDATTYVGAIESSTLFGWRIYAEAVRRGVAQAQTVIVLTDGARYNRTIAETHFPRAVHIVDLFHAYEHLTTVAQLLRGPDAKAPQPWRELLKAGEIARLIRTVGKQLPTAAQRRKLLRKELGCFEHNAQQMRYAEFRQKKYFVGSGVIEAGCRTVVGQRLKCSGMRWSVRGANAILALRTCLLSDRFEDFWASRS